MLERLELYLGRARGALRRGDRYQAMADVAEVSEIAKRVWKRLSQPHAYLGERRDRSPVTR
jgi:hypothetical protein